jgi:hypothetical protein
MRSSMAQTVPFVGSVPSLKYARTACIVHGLVPANDVCWGAVRIYDEGKKATDVRLARLG